MAMKIEDIEGIGPKYGKILRDNGINSCAKLLSAGATAQGRKNLEEKTGLSHSHVLRWVNLADLCRVKGVSTQYSELLEAAGVDSVKELRNRNAENLTTKMQEVNAEKKLVRAVPSGKLVTDWVAQAKAMAPAISY